MTPEEEKRVIEIYGEDYEELDIPAYIREREEAEARAIEAMEEDWRQEQKVE